MLVRALGLIILLGVLMFVLGNCNAIAPLSQASRTLELRETPLASSIEIASRNGSISVITDPDCRAVEVLARMRCSGATVAEAEARLAESSISITRGSDGRLIIKPVFAQGEKNNDGAALTVRLPSVQSAVIRTSNGSISVEGTAGDLDARTSNGAISVASHAGPAELSTSNGRIEVRKLAGALHATTSNGSIAVEDHAGAARLVTSNGSVRLSLQADQQAPFSISTSNASVSVTVGPSFIGAVKMATSNGSINVHDEGGLITSSEVHRTRARVIVGEGGPESMLDTSNGSVTFTTASAR